MAKLSSIKRLTKEDFDPDNYSLIDKLGFVINIAFEQIANILNGNISLKDNVNTDLVTYDVQVDALGVPKINNILKVDLNTKCYGLTVINIENLNNASETFTMPYITFREDSRGILTILSVKTLTPNTTYRLTILAIGG